MSEPDKKLSLADAIRKIGEGFLDLSEAMKVNGGSAVDGDLLKAALSQNGNGNGHQADAGLLDADGMADYLKVTKHCIYTAIGRKKNPMPHFRVGRYPRFDRDAVKAWLKENPECL